MSMTARFLPVAGERLPDVIAGRIQPINLLFPDDESDPGALDIDKSWHAIHFLLTGAPWNGEPPLCRAILGGEPVGEDGGYGPARYLTAEEVAEVATALAAVDPDDLRQRYGDGSPLVDADIYPQGWDRHADGLDYVMTHFAELVAFYRRAAGDGHAVLQVIV